MGKFLNHIKRYIRRFLIYLLKILNMTKSFDEFTTKDMDNIRLNVEMVLGHYIQKQIGTYYSIRNEKGIEYCVFEYKKQHKVTLDLNDYNNPDVSINIRKDFSCIVTGFNTDDEILVQGIVKLYLKSNDFIRPV